MAAAAVRAGLTTLQVLPRGWGYLLERAGAVQVLNWDSTRGGGCVQDREPAPQTHPNSPLHPQTTPGWSGLFMRSMCCTACWVPSKVHLCVQV